MPPAEALYIHLPFCRSVCPYCDFPVARYAQAGPDGRAGYLGALGRELGARAPGLAPRWIFVGGGTPTELTPAETAAVLDLVRASIRLDRVEEWTIEANPRSLKPEVLRLWREAGATRVSLGAQSFAPSRLQRLGRSHRAADIATGVALCRAAGFPAVNLDLIVAVPGQTAADAAADARAAAALAPDHVSVYTLTVEAGTPFARLREAGRLREAAPDAQAGQLEAARDALAVAGIVPYEVSNLARPGFECRMNLHYWRGGDYVGVGVGAASHRAGERTRNTRGVREYVAAWGAGGDATNEREVLSPPRRAAERAMLGLRLVEGFSLADVAQATGTGTGLALLPPLLELAAAGVCTIEGDRVRPTRRGLMLADAAAARVLTATIAGADPLAGPRPGIA